MSALVTSHSVAGSVCCCQRALQQQQQRRRRGLCLGCSSPQQFSTCAIPLGRCVLGSRRGTPRGSKLIRRSLRGGTRADSETEERPSRSDGNGRAVGGIEELDNQLRVLSSSENLVASSKEATQDIAGKTEELPTKDEKKVEWPVFGDGFVLYISVGLVLLTIINNVLFRVFFGPPAPRDLVKAKIEAASESRDRERFKLRSFRDPKYGDNAPPIADDPVP